jgi:amidase
MTGARQPTEAVPALAAEPRLPAPTAPVYWPAWRMRAGVVSGELDPVELVQAHLERLTEVEPALNAAVFVRDDAVADAARLRSRLASGEPPGPLWGVPITVKDVIATAGIPTEAGSGAFAGNLPSRDAGAVARLRSAGAIVIAKAACPEFAFGVTCASVAHGTTHSPWGGHSPGGSSGGDAALVAAGASALGLGTDYGGSLRWPAACCGISALRPGLGAVDGSGQLPERGGLMNGHGGPPTGPDSLQRRFQVIGPIARTVRDLSIAYAVIAGLPVPASDPTLDTVRFGIVRDLDDTTVDDDSQQAVELVSGALIGAGWSVVASDGALNGLHGVYNALRGTDPLSDLRAAVRGREARVGPEVAEILAAAPLAGPAEALIRELADRLDELRARVLGQLALTPLLVLAVAPAPACHLDGRASVRGEVFGGFALMAHCRAVTALGFPALSVPVGTGHAGLPLSVQIVGGPGREALVLAAGELIEGLLGGSPQPPWLI